MSTWFKYATASPVVMKASLTCLFVEEPESPVLGAALVQYFDLMKLICG